jgi:hypothetical protein
MDCLVKAFSIVFIRDNPLLIQYLGLEYIPESDLCSGHFPAQRLSAPFRAARAVADHTNACQCTRSRATVPHQLQKTYLACSRRRRGTGVNVCPSKIFQYLEYLARYSTQMSSLLEKYWRAARQVVMAATVSVRPQRQWKSISTNQLRTHGYFLRVRAGLDLRPKPLSPAVHSKSH